MITVRTVFFNLNCLWRWNPASCPWPEYLNFKFTYVQISFDLLLTVHLSIFISIFNQINAQNVCFTISFISCLYMFRAHVLIITRSKLHYTASGIIAGVHQTATYRCDDTRGCVMQFWPPDDEHMCSKHVEVRNKTYCETNFLHQVD